ncbi:MAG: hypothetical protein LBS91_04980 [Clostridiales Family XIII bacterium]|jgi:hypothetical protein|nr:hypothetical protein [Clostridiales Family XIII bacterium]
MKLSNKMRKLTLSTALAVFLLFNSFLINPLTVYAATNYTVAPDKGRVEIDINSNGTFTMRHSFVSHAYDPDT